MPLISSFCKADNSDSDWPSDSAAAVVRFILLSSSFSRVLCLIALTNFVTASAEHRAKERERQVTLSNFGNKDASSTAPFDVKEENSIDKEHLRGFGTWFNIWDKELFLHETTMSSKWLQFLIAAPRLFIERSVLWHSRVFRNSRLNCPELWCTEWEETTLSVINLTWFSHGCVKCVMYK